MNGFSDARHPWTRKVLRTEGRSATTIVSQPPSDTRNTVAGQTAFKDVLPQFTESVWLSQVDTPKRILPFAGKGSREAGFTLIEMIVTIVILSIVGLITIRYVASASNLYAIMVSQTEADFESMAVIDRMRRETRPMQTVLTNAEAGKLVFATKQGTNTFLLTGNEVTFNGNTLARNVNTFTLAYYNATNGLLTPLPLTNGLDRIRRIKVDLTITKGNQSSDWDFNIFCPIPGVLK